jgi:hypothetical protein
VQAKGAAVDIWHADAAGTYSVFGSDTSSRTFLRRIRKTDRNGLAASGLLAVKESGAGYVGTIAMGVHK